MDRIFTFWGACILMSLASYAQPNADRWIDTSMVYDGHPINVIFPVYSNLNRYRNQFSDILSVSYRPPLMLDDGISVQNFDGSIENLDQLLQDLFLARKTGFLFLIETYAGNRQYFYLIKPDCNVEYSMDSIQKEFPDLNLFFYRKTDPQWRFFKQYPFLLKIPADGKIRIPAKSERGKY